jgi:hypothetical protein
MAAWLFSPTLAGVARWYVCIPKFWYILEILGLVVFGNFLRPYGICYVHCVHIFYIWPFCIFYGHSVYFVGIRYIFSHVGIFKPRPIWQPWSRRRDKMDLLLIGHKANLIRETWRQEIDCLANCDSCAERRNCTMQPRSGLPDFSWYNIPKREKYTK